MMLVKFFISSAVFFLSISALDYQPPFLTPTAGTVWKSGGNYSCSWYALFSPLLSTSKANLRSFFENRNQTFPEGIHRYEVAQTAKFLLRYKSDNTSDVSDYGSTSFLFLPSLPKTDLTNFPSPGSKTGLSYPMFLSTLLIPTVSILLFLLTSPIIQLTF